MRNLAHLPLEDVESFPEKISMGWEVVRRPGPPPKRYYYRYRKFGAWERLSNKVDKIIEASVGDNWDNIYSKLRELVRDIRFNFDLDKRLQSSVYFPFWSVRNQRWEFSYRSGGGDVRDLYKHIQWVKTTDPRKWSSDFYYICPISNMLRCVRIKKNTLDLTTEGWRRHYKMLQDRRRDKKARKKREDHILKMINNPPLMKFYGSLVREYRAELNAREYALQRYEEAKARKDKGHKLRMNFRRRQLDQIDRHFIQRMRKLDSLRYQIEELEAGRFDSYFESNVYLYAMQKECHHFEQP